MSRDRPRPKVCSLLEWSFVISIDTSWDWFQRTYHHQYVRTLITMEEFITELANYPLCLHLF